MIVTLAILNGPRKGFSADLASPGRYIVGSSETADFRIATNEDPFVSGQQALIEVTRSRCTIQSLAGVNPLSVNGEHIRNKSLSDGDVVQVGFTRLGIRTSTPYCYLCGKTDDELIELAESDGRFCEFREIAVYAHAACLRPEHQFLGRKIAGFDIQRCLGRGGFGSVWLVHDRKTSRLWAIKQISGVASEDYLYRFQREGRFLIEFVHSRIARCLGIGDDPEAGSYLMCEFVPGQDLARFVRENGPQPPSWTIDIVTQILAGLHFLHTRPGVIVHRDVKPENVLLKRGNCSGAAPVAKLADFGIARALEGRGSTRLTTPGMVPGTFLYLAPEVFSGRDQGPLSDVYSAGVTAYYTLTGKHPYDFPSGAADAALLHHLWSSNPVPVQLRLSAVPAAVAGAVNRACSKEPKDRHSTALEFAEALNETRTG